MSKSLKDKLSQLSQEDLVDLTLQLAETSSENKKRVQIYAASKDPKQCAQLIGKSITALKSWLKRVDPYQSFEAGDKLSEISTQISQNLLKQDPTKALDLLKRLVDLCNEMMSCIDDSYGNVSGAFGHIFTELDQAFQAADTPSHEVIAFYIQFLENEEYGMSDTLIKLKTTQNLNQQNNAEILCKNDYALSF